MSARRLPRLPGPTARRLAIGNGVARCALGLVALGAPALPLRPWVGEDAERSSAALLARALGGRDLAIGLGAVLAGLDGAPLRRWVQAAGVADLGDVGATLGHFRDLPRVGRWLVLAAAASGVAAAAVAAPAVDL